ncbi:hypothetical protein CPC08DRAFT_274689 [Agrocybe pediades]|nr:hypothetical protein CPC08DRAFT_274689 [Agrocybe pediades]
MSNYEEVPPVSFQKALIATNLHSTFLILVFAGIQMMVYLGLSVDYPYVSKAPNRRIVISGLNVLTGALLGQEAAQWYYADVIYVEEGETRFEVYDRAFSYRLAPPWFNMLAVILKNIAFLVADGLLIWRCFHVCGRSFRRITLPLLFFGAEIGELN